MTQTTEFSSLLVANRGEIALRVMKTARASGLKCIAVFTDADADAPHVAFADTAVNIGAGPVVDSYLNVEKILNAAEASGAEAIHPGYGFLSESDAFAAACVEAGLVFVGPSPKAIKQMGNKAEAKRLMISAGVPCIPGYEGTDQSDTALLSEAEKIGFPVMIKATAGGGGRGMRLVETAAEFPDALHIAQAEAQGSFGSAEMILEKAVQNPRHVEIQVIADRYGHTIHLGERDCSVQRRHQKVVEEAPCPVMTDALRINMGEAAVKAAASIGYEGAGTVEFLLDAAGQFYFLEMNTRLQVEHPVTEMVTGLDLVDLQLKIAAGEALSIAQNDVVLGGHAMEVRLYAEDPENEFLPATGRVEMWNPAVKAGGRIDTGIRSGIEISPYYDPLLAKVIAHGKDREDARNKLIHVLRDTTIFGPETNRDFLIDVLGKPSFVSGEATTAFIADEYGETLGADSETSWHDVALTSAVLHQTLTAQAERTALSCAPELRGWGSSGKLRSRLTLSTGTTKFKLQITQKSRDELYIQSAEAEALVSIGNGYLRIDGQRVDVTASHFDGETIFVSTGLRTLKMQLKKSTASDQKPQGSGTVTAPMHGNLLDVFVTVGTAVEKGTRLAVLEAMKMQHEVISEVSGTVTEVLAQGGEQVRAGDILVEIKVSED